MAGRVGAREAQRAEVTVGAPAAPSNFSSKLEKQLNQETQQGRGARVEQLVGRGERVESGDGSEPRK